MFDDIKDLLEIAKEGIFNVVTSRLFALGVVFIGLFTALVFKLFQLQIIDGESYLRNYISTTEKFITINSTRGNIFDRNGNVLAYNELAYSVTIQDNGAYPKNQMRNTMLLELVKILDKHGENIQGRLEIAIDENGQMYFTTTSEAAKKRFLRDYYGLRSTNDLDKDGKNPSNVTARDIFEQREEKYGLDVFLDSEGNPHELDDTTALKIMNIRYTMGLTSYQKYATTTVASHVSDKTVADILEHTASLDGVNIEEDTIRVYEDSIYFAPIIGYTGRVTEEQLTNLKAQDDSYELNDIVGQSGIEASMELDLKGTKGTQDMIVDNMGRIRQITSRVEPMAGKDLYLTCDRDLQIAIYKILEQQLAGVLVNTLVPREVDPSENTDSSKIKIPIKDAYYQLINNNVLSLAMMGAEDASEIEKQINGKFLSAREQILTGMRAELQNPSPVAMGNLPDDMKAYMQYVVTYLSGADILIDKSIDKNNDVYKAWAANEISLREYLYAGIANNWIDTTRLQIQDKYSNADSIFEKLVEYVLNDLPNDTKFTKRIYRYLVNDETVSGRELCLALYEQGVLEYDENQVNLLTVNGNNYAYTFLLDKIRNIEITPAQLALDPCTAGCVVTDVNTGEVLALVTYPSYDNNKFSGGVDAAYFRKLQEDMSRPLYNYATQSTKAPGSTFKVITAIAGLEDHAIGLNDTVDCTGVYREISPPLSCWVSPGHHGKLNLLGGIQNSCNYYFADIAHRLSTDEFGNYSTERGLTALNKYATMFGLDHKSGIEITENEPEISTEDPERSAMGQGKNSFANVQLSRYVAAVANRGTVFELSLIDKFTDSEGNLLEDRNPEVYSQLDFDESTWNAVQNGMRAVVTSGSARNIFKDLEVDIAGKTGTAQEIRGRGNHAFFISYGPFENPEICVTVNIPNGYSSSNAAMVAKNVYKYYYGYTDLDYIQNHGALDASGVTINGD